MPKTLRPKTGKFSVWESRNHNNWQTFGAVPVADWEIAGIGDFNGNGTDDILWRSKSNGIVSIWESGQAGNWQQLGSASNEWEIQLA